MYHKRKPVVKYTYYLHLIIVCFSVTVGCRSNQNIKPKQPDTVAFRTIKFGLTENSFNKQFGDTLILIKNTFFKPKALFVPDDHRLCMLQLRSPDRGYDEFKFGVKDDMNTLIEEISKLYGNPSRYFRRFNVKELEIGKVGWMCEWVSPKKNIKIGIARLIDDEALFPDHQRYIATCELTHIPLKSLFNQQVIYIGTP
jgi:hypothetical protein